MNCYMTVCRESGVEDTDDLYPGKKPRQEQNFETHSPSGPVYLSFQFPSLTYRHGSQYGNQTTNVLCMSIFGIS